MSTKGEPAELTELSGNYFSTATSFSFDSRAKELNQLCLLLVEPTGHKAEEGRWRKLEEEDHPGLAALSYQMGSAVLLVLTLPVAFGALPVWGEKVGKFEESKAERFINLSPSLEGAASRCDGLIGELESSTLNLFEDLAFFLNFFRSLLLLCSIKLSGKKAHLFVQEHLNHNEVGQVIIAHHIVVLLECQMLIKAFPENGALIRAKSAILYGY